MYPLKTNSTTIGKPTPEPLAQNTTASRNVAALKPLQTPQSPATAAADAAAVAAIPRSAHALIAAAGLPSDKLSASIISFAHFFSLPLKPELMSAIRRQAFAPSPAAATVENVATAKHMAASAAAETALTESAATKNREALSLAATAAESKGVELHPKGLEAFAEAIDPEWEKRQDPGGRERRRDKNSQQEEENAPSKADPITATSLKEMALNAVEQNPLLAILNRLPGKNGRRWVALPFSFNEGGRVFRLSLRILLANGTTATHVVVDIAETGETETESPGTGPRWLFALEASAPGLMAAGPANRLTVYLQPELPPKAHAHHELSALLDIPLERVTIKNRTESFPCEAGCTDKLPLSINEAV